MDDTDIRISDAVPPTANAAFTALHLPFVGFTFTQGSAFCDLSSVSKDSIKTSGVSITQVAAEQRIRQLEEENTQLLKKLQGKIITYNQKSLWTCDFL